ncbi:MAG: hypothetical protein HC890_09980 [Chloroflexaceae bacterium]|nr:hypothetical protein [Chloroflexaceae bacterium]
MKSDRNLKILKFLGITMLTFLLLILVFMGLPAILLLLQVPSFKLGEGIFWLARWQNETEGSSIKFNLVLLFLIAIVVGFFSLWRPFHQTRDR